MIELTPYKVSEPGPSSFMASSEEVGPGFVLGASAYNIADDNRTVLQFMPWSEHISRPDAVRRHQVMAETLDATYVTVDNPGVGFLSTNLSRDQRADLRHGQLESLATSQYEAARRTGIDMGKISLVGYSLGGVMASAMANVLPQDTEIDKIVLIEPAGVNKSSIASLGANFMLDGLRDRQYRAENPAWFSQLPQTAPPQRAVLYDYIRLMNRGKAYDNLADISNNRGAQMTIVTGEKSRIIPPVVAEQLADYLNADWLMLKGENHSMLNSLGRVAALFDLLHSEDRL